MLDEQTTPKDNLEFGLCADGGGTPGGVLGRGSLCVDEAAGMAAAMIDGQSKVGGCPFGA
jgi:hypothetical protein